jgi:hypothetical protein
VTVEDWCLYKPETIGCPEKTAKDDEPAACCEAVTATCEACKTKVTVQQYCEFIPETEGCAKVIAAEAAKKAFESVKEEALSNGVKDPADTEDSGCWLANIDIFGKTVDILCENAKLLKVVISLMSLTVISYN